MEGTGFKSQSQTGHLLDVLLFVTLGGALVNLDRIDAVLIVSNFRITMACFFSWGPQFKY